MYRIKLNPSENTINYRPGEFTLALCDASNEAFSIDLPDAQNFHNELIIIKTDSSENTITINTVDNQTISGDEMLSLTQQYDRYFLLSDGENWLNVSGMMWA